MSKRNPFKDIQCSTGEVAKDYNEYLKTRHWRLIRNKVAIREEYKCLRCCGIFRENFNIHHNSYKRLGKEWSKDLDLYCSKCHKVIHNDRKNKKDFNRHYSNIISEKMSKLSKRQIEDVIKYIDTLPKRG